jgi:DNA-binding NarL/FixJ family response regulator
MTLDQVLGEQGKAPVFTTAETAQPARPMTKHSPSYPDGLTAREVEVLRFIAKGLTDAQIAEQLVISPRTVKNHLASIYGKIQVSSRSAATRYAIEHQIV